MKDVIRRLLSSTKFLTMVATVVSTVIARWGFDIPSEEITPIIAVVVSWLLGQGLADIGKHAK